MQIIPMLKALNKVFLYTFENKTEVFRHELQSNSANLK
jgi:hypothetical protein